MEKFFKRVLCEIAEQTYDEPVVDFKLKINPEERKGFHGRYFPDKKLIEIFNLYRENRICYNNYNTRTCSPYYKYKIS